MKLKLLVILLAGIRISTLAWGADLPSTQPTGRSEFVFEQGGLQVLVRYFVPDDPSVNLPVVFVMPGIERNGSDYLSDWVPYARQNRFVLVVPEFSASEFRGARGYQDGNTVSRYGIPVPRLQWTYSMIEPIFDAICQRTGDRSEKYYIYGHSAGAQFVERFICFVPRARIACAVVANAGSYMLPTLDQAFPYGFGGTALGEGNLRAFLAQPLVVLLGSADRDPQSKYLSHTPEAETQGPNRLRRGTYFFFYGVNTSGRLQTPFGWKVAYAPRIGHSDDGMASFAVKCLFRRMTSRTIPFVVANVTTARLLSAIGVDAVIIVILFSPIFLALQYFPSSFVGKTNLVRILSCLYMFVFLLGALSSKAYSGNLLELPQGGSEWEVIGGASAVVSLTCCLWTIVRVCKIRSRAGAPV